MEMPQIFENKEFGKVRVTEYNGAPWFVASDVAKALGYERPADAVNIHCKKANKITQYCDSPDRVKTPPINLNIIPESDVYRLVMRPNLPGAERFQDWVVEEVLPAIRKHGGYLTPKKLEEALLNPDVLIRLATQLKEEREARVQAEARVAILSHVRKTYTTTEIAKELGMRSAVALNRLLCERRVQFKQNGTYVLYAEYAEHGYVHIKQEILENDKIVYHRRWTQLGREWLLDMLG